jgi:transcription antitermination factor NusG
MQNRGVENYWHLLRCKPFKECFVHKQLAECGFETFNPHNSVNPANLRPHKLRPYYPGYLSLKAADCEDINTQTSWLPGSLGLVTFGSEPARLIGNIIDSIRKRINELKPSDPQSILWIKGMRAKVTEGLFSGFEGIFGTHLLGTD